MPEADPTDTRLGVVIVAHRSEQLLPGLLATLSRHQPDVPIVVVDNASPGGAPPAPGARLVALPQNRGYGSACNAGAAPHSSAGGVRYLAFLNPDVRLRGPSLSELAAALDARSEVGIATGPVVDDRGERVPSAWGPPSPVRAFWFGSGLRLPRLRRLVGRLVGGGAMTSGASTARDDLKVDGYVVGGAMVVRRECWEQIGGFDEGFFLFGEDADLCKRARDAGWEIRVLPCTPIEHLRGSSSAGVTSAQRAAWYEQGLRRYASKHLSRSRARLLLAAYRSGRMVSHLRPGPRSA